MSDAANSPQARLRSILENQRVPESMVRAAQTPLTIAPNQIWRVRWEHRAQAVLVNAVSGSQVECTSVYLEPVLGGPHLIEATASDLSSSRGVIVRPDSAQHTLHKRVFDHPLISVAIGLETIDNSTDYNGSDPIKRAELDRDRSERLDTLEFLAAANWVPAESETLESLLKRTALPASIIAAALSIKPGKVLEFYRGRDVPTRQQIEDLAKITNIDRQTLMNAGVKYPNDLIETIDDPATRPLIDRLLVSRNDTESYGRQLIARKCLTMSARQTGTATPNWRARIEHSVTALLGADRD